MSVHYKFKSALSFDTITFDGLHISIRDLKKAILQQKQIGKASDFDLQITNAQSNEVYEDDNVLVPKNSSLIVVRIPLTSQQKKASEKSDVLPALGGKGLQGDGLDPLANKLAKTVDLANVEASETDKIQAAITQSTLDYDPSKIKGSNQVGELPANYRCYKCLQPGHWIRDCKLNAQPDSAVDIKKSTGIPRSFMVPVEGPEVPGAMMTPTGQFAVPSIEHEARKEPIRKVTEPVVVEKPAIPSDLICGVCKDLLADAVLIPCCGNSFCDECIRNVLLESEDHQCPDCREKDVSPDTLIPNRFLRNSVNTFRNQTGYVKTPSKLISQVVEKKISSPIKPETPAEELKVEEKEENRSSPTLSIKEHDLTKEDTRSPSDELEIVEDSSSSVVTPFPADINQQALSQGAAIPSLSNPLASVSTEYDPNLNENVVENLLPIPNIAVYSRSQPNPKICLKGEETGHHMRKDKSHFIINRHERSGTPTIDEHNHMDGSNRYRIESIGRMQPRLIPPMRQPPPMYNHGNYMYYPAPPMYLGPPRGPDMLLRMPHYGHQPPYNRSRTRPPYAPPQNGGQPGTIADPYEMFKKILKDKDRRRAKRRSRSISRSYSRSPTPRMRSRARSRTPRSRSRSRTRSRTRSRSRSRSAHYHERRKRTRSRSFTMSRSPYSDRSSPNRERHYASPRIRTDRHSPGYVSPTHSRSRNERHSPSHVSPNMRIRSDRHSPTYSSPTPRYYSQKYKDEIHRNQSKGSSDRRRHPTKSQDYYQSDYPRRSDRYEARYARERDHERERDKSDRDKDRTKYDDSLRALAAQDWEKTRDRELELRKRESREQELYEKTRKSALKAVETIESTSREILLPPGVMLEEDRGRVLIDVKREPSDDIPLSKSPEKEKKSKEKKKRRKDEVDKKKKKKRSKDKGDKKEETFSTNDSVEPLIESPKEDVKEIKFEQIMDIFANEKDEPIPDKDVVLAPVPELSKWEKDEEAANPSEENIFPDNDDTHQVTSEVIKRAENAIIFKKVNKPIESKKPERRVELAKKSENKIQQEKKPEIEKSRDNERRDERYKEKNNEKDERRNKEDHQGRHSSKDTPRSVAVVKPDKGQRSSDRKHEMQPHRISAKERLGAKVEDKLVVKREIRGERREIKIEKMPPKSIVSKDSSRDRDKDREKDKERERDKDKEKVKKEIKIPEKIQIPEIKKIHAIEEIFEPDYEKSDHEEKPETIPPLQFDFKRAHSPESDKEIKKIKLSLEEKSSTADSSLSSDDSDEKRHKKRKKSKKHKKRKKKRKHNSSSDSDSSTTSSDSDTDKRKKKHKHKSHKKSKKRKKSKK